MAKKPWRTKEWKERRKALLKTRNKCEWGCSNKGPLTIDHLRNFNALRIWKRAYSQFLLSYFGNGNHQDELDHIFKDVNVSLVPKYVGRCPKCKGSGITKRKWKKPRFRCHQCKWEGERLLKVVSWNTKGKQRSMITKLILKLHKPKIDLIYQSMKTVVHDAYLNFEEVIVLCRRCAFARRKGYVLCQNCKKKYHRTRYFQCYSCMSKDVARSSSPL